MKFPKVSKAMLSRAAGKTWLALKKSSPTLLMIGAGVSVVAGTVIACKQTMKLNDILEDHEKERAMVDKVFKDEEGNVADEKGMKKEITKTYVRTGLKVAKLYSVPATMLAGGLTMAGFSHHIMVNRNGALAAGLASATTAFDKYRKHVKEELGEEADTKFLTGLTKKEVEVVKKDENGNEVVEKKEVNISEQDPAGLYSFFFDPSSREWVKDANSNKNFLIGRQNYFNELLSSRGYVFLNEVLHELDIPITAAGQMVGWYYDPENPDAAGDNFIDFGIFDAHSPSSRDFVNGYEPVALLNFNCDGNILGHMKHGFPCDHVR